MSFATAVQTFALVAARSRRDLLAVSVQPLTAAEAATGNPCTVALTPTRTVQEITENGVSLVQKAQLRVLESVAWVPAAGSKFRVVATSEVYRVVGAASHPGEITAERVFDVVRL